MTNRNESDHPRDKKGKFTYKGGSSSSTKDSNENKMQNRADILYPTMKDKENISNLKETNPIKKYNDIQTEIFKQNLFDKSLEVAIKSGNTGISNGPHLHITIKEDGKPVNPKKYLQF